MYKSLLIIVVILLAVVAWQSKLFTPLTINDEQQTSTGNASSTPSQLDEQSLKHHRAAENQHNTTRDIFALLKTGNYDNAITEFDIQYASMSTEQIENTEQRIFQTALDELNQQNSHRAIALLARFNESYQHPQAWYILGIAYNGDNQLDLAVDAFLQSLLLEHQPDRIDKAMQALNTSAKQWQNELAQQEDWQTINDLYLSLYNQFPNSSRFQLALAKSYLSLNDQNQAINLLTQLQYDEQLGSIAKQLLTEIEQNNTPEPERKPNKNNNALVVPLIRSGNSFLIKVNINRRPFTLLLDTGASITALSPDVIRRLNLKPNGQRIRLNTANGVRQSSLYIAKEIKLDKAIVKHLPIAEIDLGNNSRIHGLLGTDVLNQFNYVIDNQQEALVLKRL